jgi:hypothetical protein
MEFCKSRGVPTMLLRGVSVLQGRGANFIKAGGGEVIRILPPL